MGTAEEIVIGPNPGPQSAAFASTADITVYGGQAGGGKTYLTLLRFAVHADRVSGYSGTIFRRELPQVKMGGGMWRESMSLYPVFGAQPNKSELSWTFPNGSVVQFDSMQHEKNKIDFQGAQLHEFCFEEATHFEESQFWYLFSRLRTMGGGDEFASRCMLTCNPDPDSWVRRLIDWYIGADGLVIPERAGKKRYFLRDGDEMLWGDTAAEVMAKGAHLSGKPQTLRFIPATLTDNPKGDPNYRSKLEALPRIERDRLLGGNWNVRAIVGSYFKRSYFDVVDRAPGKIVSRVRAWDLAGTEPHEGNKDPDWTVGVKLAKLEDGRWIVEHVERVRYSPGKVEDTLRIIAAQDGVECKQCFWQDPAQAGKAQAEHIAKKVLRGYATKFVVASKDKETYASPVSSLAEHKQILLLRGGWNEPFLSVLEGFPVAKKKDDVDALSRAAIELGGWDHFEVGYDAAPDPRHPSANRGRNLDSDDDGDDGYSSSRGAIF